MKLGHYMATTKIPLELRLQCLPKGGRFDVLNVSGEQVLLRFAGMETLEQRAQLENRSIYLAPLIVANDGYHMIMPGEPS